MASVFYSPSGTNDFMSWSAAARIGGIDTGTNVVGQPRSYAVDAWVNVDELGLVNMNGLRLSHADGAVRKAFLQELDLPLTKQLVYRGKDRLIHKVADLWIRDVWDGWYVLNAQIDTGEVVGIHSMYLAEMNKGTTYPQSYIVFDLETTGSNPQAADICEIAAIRVTDGEVNKDKDLFSQLVYIDGDMPSGAQDVHHISKSMLMDKPHMKECLKAFIDFVEEDSVLVGHNIKQFDIPLLKRVAQQCDLEFKFERDIDTLALAKKVLPGIDSYSLDALRPTLKIDAEGAHRGLKDCWDVKTLYEGLRSILVDDKAVHEVFNLRLLGEKQQKRQQQRKRTQVKAEWAKRKKAKDFKPETTVFDTSHPLYLKNVVITGDIPYGTREDAMQRISNLGGTPQDNVTMATNYLVVGTGAGKTKLDKAKRYQRERGIPIEIVSGIEFSRLLEA